MMMAHGISHRFACACCSSRLTNQQHQDDCEISCQDTMMWVLQPHCSAEASPGLAQVTYYCLLVSSCFVGSLYVLVPARVRQLDRDDCTQIQWRTVAISIACLGAVTIYPFFSCEDLVPVARLVVDLPGFLKAEFVACQSVLVHISLLYLGPLVRNSVAVHQVLHSKRIPFSSTARAYLETYYQSFLLRNVAALKGMYGSSEQWMALRNLIIAPALEEVAFRGCIVSALLSAKSLSTGQIVFLAPLFFGVAHVHHGWMCLRRGEPWTGVALQVLFQFVYTSLFGSYATWVYLRTRSLLAAILAHSYCNAMGLPDLTFWHQSSPLHAVRWCILGAHGIGLAAFAATMNALLHGRGFATF